MKKTAVFTICARNYLHFAKTLLQSVSEQHPDWERHLLLTDRADGVDFAGFGCQVTALEEMDLPQLYRFLFRYTILELCTAVKPWMFQRLFDLGYERVVYLDPDICLYQPLTEVEQAFDKGRFMVLTPHLTGALDDRKPNEIDILRAGVYNLGFLGLAASPQLQEFLSWWQEKLEYHCVVDFDRGYFVDQKWMDLTPGRFEEVEIIHHPGYNVAYWNLHHRRLKKEDGHVTVNGRPLVFYHFSGLNPANPEPLSKHQDRFSLKDLPVLAELAEAYIARLKAFGLSEYRGIEYAFSRFDDGRIIADLLRKFYRDTPALIEQAGDNPFQNAGFFLDDRKESGEGKLPIVNELMMTLWTARPDLWKAFPNPLKADRTAFCRWFVHASRYEYDLPAEYTRSVLDSLRRYQRGQETRESMLKRLKSFAKNSFNRCFYWLMKKFVLTRVVKGLIPARTRELIKRWFSRQVWPMSHGRASKVTQSGVNIIGYARAEMGIGEVSRISAKSLNTTDIPFGIINYGFGNDARSQDESWSGKEVAEPNHSVNLFAMNADQLPLAYMNLGNRVFSGRYNIGYWAWELPDFPDEWTNAFQLVNEVWVLSDFILKSVSFKSTVPVLTMPLAIEVNVPSGISREYFGLPADRFLFLTMYDTHSFQPRKNPQGSIAAFQKAFAPRSTDAGLVVKVNNAKSNPAEVDRLRRMIEGWPNIYIIDRILPRAEVNALLACTDSYISLHRSEGFGLGLAEAMVLGKSAIGTNWSGNTDFMNAANSCPVDYELVKIGEDYGPYKAYQTWAEPDLDHAAHYMRKLLAEPAWGKTVGEHGQETIQRNFSPQAVGRLMRARLRQLGLVD